MNCVWFCLVIYTALIRFEFPFRTTTNRLESRPCKCKGLSLLHYLKVETRNWLESLNISKNETSDLMRSGP